MKGLFMACIRDWAEGLRIRTLPAALAPVAVGAAFAADAGLFSPLRTLSAALTALFFQIGVNFSNDYSDGIRGTDTFRSGPPRLTGGGKANPKTVLAAACLCFALACAAGFLLVWLSGKWWLTGIGGAAVAAAWFYTGGRHPYGYCGLGEVFVFVFFGFVATVGTAYTQTGSAPAQVWVAAGAVGLIACALLMINNIRDIPTDTAAGKHTLAVFLGDRRARGIFVFMLTLPLALGVLLGFLYPFLLILPVLLPQIITICAPVAGRGRRKKAEGADLIPVLKQTGIYELTFALVLSAGITATARFFPGSVPGVPGAAPVFLALLCLAVPQAGLRTHRLCR